MAAQNPPPDAEIVTVFRSRLRADGEAEYHALAPRIAELAEDMPGFVERKGFVAEDGERLTLVTFASLAHEQAWRDHAEHRVAQKRGRAEFYETYDIKVCEVLRHHHWEAPG